MSRKPPKTAVVAFKVEEQLADFLNKLPNKSAFIRKAIAAQLNMACPLCSGAGVVPRAVGSGPVLLVDDLVDSRWTLTVAGSLLRGAGSGPVYPFALAVAAPRGE